MAAISGDTYQSCILMLVCTVGNIWTIIEHITVSEIMCCLEKCDGHLYIVDDVRASMPGGCKSF